MTASALLLAVMTAVAPADWNIDPLAWRLRGEAVECASSGFALIEAGQGREVAVSAKFTPTAAATPEWATAGVAIRADDRAFWHMALVKMPDANGAKHIFELAMMHDGQWPVQARLRHLGHKVSGQWEFGREYELRLTMDRQGVRGEVVDVADGKVLYTSAYAFTGVAAADRGAPALRVTGNFKGTFREVRREVNDAVAVAAAKRPPAYPKDSAAAAVSRATGFFRVEERDGRWTAIDPNGAPFTVLGVDHVQPHGMYCETLGYAPYGRHVKEHYPNNEAWAAETLGRLKDWGFNALGAGCDFRLLGHRGLVHTIFLNMGSRMCYGDGEWWIRENLHAPCTAFPNVFHPDFARACEWVARRQCAAAKDDPWVFGYFIDNELCWWGGGGRETGMFDAVKALPDGHTAKRALTEFLAGRKPTTELKREFLALVADRYFSATVAAIRRHDPNHLVLGCRFAGFGGAHDVVWRTAAKYCDVVTFNCYPWADLDRNVMLDRKGGVPISGKFDEFYAKVRRPMLLTEWSFPALDTGRPCYHGAGQRFATQDLRVQATALFAKTLLALPYFVGYDYFMWVDQPAPGMNHFFPEDSNYGLVMEDGTPHRGITSMFAALHRDVAKWRVAGLPVPRAYTPPPAVTERERFLAEAKGDGAAVRFAHEGNGWTLANDAGLVLRGAVGNGKDMVSAVSLDGLTFGTLGGLAELVSGDGHAWIDAREVKKVEFVREGACGAAVVTAEGGNSKQRFEIAIRVTLAPGRKDFCGDIVSIRNLSAAPLKVEHLFLRPFAVGPSIDEEPHVPNLWKGVAEGGWRLKDGASYRLRSNDPDVAHILLWRDKKGGGQHPDVAFSPAEQLTLAPGASYRPPRPLSALIQPKK